MSKLFTTNFSSINLASPLTDNDAIRGMGAMFFGSMTTAQADSINSGDIPDGAVVYVSDTQVFQFREAGAWVILNGNPGGTLQSDTSAANTKKFFIPVFEKNGDNTKVIQSLVQADTQGNIIVPNTVNLSEQIKPALDAQGSIYYSSVTNSFQFNQGGNFVEYVTHIPSGNQSTATKDGKVSVAFIQNTDKGTQITDYGFNLTYFGENIEDLNYFYLNMPFPLNFDNTKMPFLIDRTYIPKSGTPDTDNSQTMDYYTSPILVKDDVTAQVADRPFAINADLAYIGALGFMAYQNVMQVSSRNIKTIISDADVLSESLEIFKKLSFKKYTYKDQVKGNKGIFYGVIAEEIQEIMPQFTVNKSEFLPNIYTEGRITDVRGVSKDKFLCEISFFKEDFKLSKDINVEDKIRIYLEEESKEEFKDCVIKSTKDNSIVLETDHQFKHKDIVFVYGTYGNCPSVNKPAYFEIGMIVLQGLLTKVESLTQEVEDLKLRVHQQKSTKKEKAVESCVPVLSFFKRIFNKKAKV